MKECDIEKLYNYCNAVVDECERLGVELDYSLPCYCVDYSFEDGERKKDGEYFDPSGDVLAMLTHYECAEGRLSDFIMTQSEIILGVEEEPNDLRLFSLDEVKRAASCMVESSAKDSFHVKENELVIVEISYKIDGKMFQSLVITSTDWYDIYDWPVPEDVKHPEYVVINEALDTLDQMREQFIDLIQGMVDEDECIDFTEDDKFHDDCDRAYVGVYDRRADCTYIEEIYQVNYDYVTTENGYDKNLEDMEAKELLQTYRCLCELTEWKETGKISYE